MPLELAIAHPRLDRAVWAATGRPRWWCRAGFGLVVLAVVLAACGSAGSEEPVALEPTLTAATAGVDTASPTREVPATAVPRPTPTPSPPSAAELYAELSPSSAFIETATGTGSGILIEGGYVLTNHHVVEAGPTIRIVFPNGTEITDAPVFAQDLHADLALLGPIDTALPMIDLAAASYISPVPGQAVYLLGYPDEYEKFPQSTMTEGIISRFRTLELYDWEFIQVDALIAPGQSGGALFNERGEFLGTSGLRFGAQDFGLVYSGGDVQDRVAEMLADPTLHRPTDVGDRVEFSLPGLGSQSWLIDTPNGSVSISVDDEVDLGLELTDVSGALVPVDFGIVDYLGTETTRDGGEAVADDSFRGTETMEVQVEPGQYIVSVYNYDADETTNAVIESTTPLMVFADVEKELPLEPGVIAWGLLDDVTDRDVWLAELTEGDEVELRIDSISDTTVVVRGPSGELQGSGDDGYGLMGNGSESTFTITESGKHMVQVGRFGGDTGGYAIRLDIK